MKKLILSWFMIWAGYALMGQQPNFIPNITGQTLIDKVNNNGPTTADEDHFGTAVANIGDLDLDGVDDIAVGANGDDNGGSVTDNYGAVYICFMNSDKTVKSSVKIGKGTSGIGSDIAMTDNFGCSIVGLGDMDGDGYVDIAVGAPNTDITSFSNSGAIYILFMHKTGSILSYKKIVRGSHGGPTTIKATSAFGFSLANIGDINGDLTVDLAVGGNAHNGPSSGSDNGAVWILKMRKDGEVIGDTIITKSTGWSVVLNNSDFFGGSVVSPGDLNGDGVNDLLVGCIGDDEAGANLGAIYLLYLDSSGLVISYKKYIQPFFKDIYTHKIQSSFGRSIATEDLDQDGQPEIIVGSSPNEAAIYVLHTDTAENITDVKRYSANIHWNLNASGYGVGVSVATLRDIDKDGKMELLLGASIYDSPSSTNNGAVLIVDMDTVHNEINAGELLSYDKYGAYSDTIASFVQTEQFGSAVCDIGDVNGDGWNDIAVGALGNDDGGTNKGAVYIIFLDSLQRKISVQKISDISGGLGSGLDANDDFGRSLAAPGDLDGDTIPDLIVGAHLDDDGGTDRGCIWVVYLNNNGTVKGKHKISSTHGITGLDNSDQFGLCVASIGDINNDGINDLAVGANLDDDGGSNRGAVWILFMNAADSVASAQKISDTQGSFTETFSGNSVNFGSGVFGPGDLNGDGTEDLLVGSALMDGTGAGYVLFLDTTGNVIDYKKINNATGNFPVTIQSGTSFGSVIAAVNDLDGNGIKEIVLSNSSYNSFGTAKGAVWIAFPDSSYNIYATRLIGEESPFFNPALGPSELFGRAFSPYLASDGTHRLFIGSEATEKFSLEGAVFMVYPAAMDSASLRGMAYSAGDIIAKRPAKGFYDLNRTIDGGMYYPSGTHLQFKYFEEYRSGTMQYNIYRSNQTLLYTGTSSPLYNEITGTSSKSIGQNYFKLNLGSGGLNLATGNYILETINDKTEKMYLRFSYKALTEIPGPTVPVVLGP